MTDVQTGRSWRIVIPTPAGWITDNDSRRNVHAHNRKVQAWRQAAYIAAWAVKPRIPTGLDLVQVDCLLRYAKPPVREIANLRSTLKACVDGAVGKARGTAPGYGIVVDDSDRHVRYGAYDFELISVSPGRRALNPYAGEVVLTVTELAGGAA